MDIKCQVVGNVMTNCYFAVNKEAKEYFIVDPGGEKDRLIAQMEQLEEKPTAILLTHGHFDHILAVKPLAERYQLPVYACRAEEELLGDAAWNMSSEEDIACEIKADRYLEDEEEFTASHFVLRCLHTPGHTPGSCCFYLPQEKVLFSGDTLFCGSVGRTDFPGGSMRQMLSSLHRLLDILPEDTAVYPGHDRPTTIGYEKRYNPFV